MKGARTVPEDIRTFAQAMLEQFVCPELQALGDRMERIFKEHIESVRLDGSVKTLPLSVSRSLTSLGGPGTPMAKVAKAPTLEIEVEPLHVLNWREKRVDRKNMHGSRSRFLDMPERSSGLMDDASLESPMPRHHAESYRQMQAVQSNLSKHKALLPSSLSPRGGGIVPEPPVGRESWLPGGWMQRIRKAKSEEHWQKEETQFRPDTESGNVRSLCCSAHVEHNRHERYHDGRADHGSSWLDRLVRNPAFTNTVFALVVLNAVVVGVQVDYMARNWLLEAPAAFMLVDRAFCVVFCVEISLRIWVYGLHGFFTMPGWEWNVFESAIVFTQVTEHLIHIFLHGHRIWKWVACVRSLRLIRIVRVASVLNRFQQLRMLLVSVSASFKSLGWVLGLLVFMTYAVACYITQLVTEHKIKHFQAFREIDLDARSEDEGDSPNSVRALFELYGSLDRSVFALYMMLSEGTHWGELVAPLSSEISPWSKWMFFFFSGFAIFAVLNVITGVFVESAIKTANEDKKNMLAKQTRTLFQRADSDWSGDLSWAEFEEQLETHDMQACFREIDVDPEDAKEVFRLLDIDDSGTVNQEEMVHGMSKLMGEAKSIDLATLTHEFAQSQVRWVNHAKWLESTLLLLIESVSMADPCIPE